MTTRNPRRIGTAFTSMLLATVLTTSSIQAGGRRHAVSVSRLSSGLMIMFLDAGSSPLPGVDVGTIAWAGGRRRSTTTSRRITMRIGAPAPESRGTVTIRAFLETPDARSTVRVNGVVLGAAPQVVQHHAPVGIPITHRLEIEVPTSTPAGPLHTNIGWEVTTP